MDRPDIDMHEAAARARSVLASRPALIAAGFFVAAFAVRWLFAQHGFWIDEGRALLIAKNFLHGNGFRYAPDRVMWKHPFVFYTLIAVSYLFLGVKAVAGMVTTNVLAALTVATVFLTGRELFDEWAGIAAGTLMAVLPIHMFYSTRVLTDVPGTFFVALTLYFWARTETREEAWSFYAMFAAAGFTLLTKLTGIVVLPALFIYYLWKERGVLFLKKRYWYGAAITAGLYGLWEVRNLLTVGFIGIVQVFLGKYLSAGGGGGAGGGGAGALGGFVSGIGFHLTQLPNTMGLPAALLLGLGLVFAYIYRDRRMTIPLVFLATAFVVLSQKTLNRYFLPFHPMAAVVAGYAVYRLRDIAAAKNERAANVVFALVLVASAAVMFQTGAAMISSSANGFTGLEEAGKWIRQNSAEDAVVIAGSSNQIRFFSDRTTIHAGSIKSTDEFYRVLTEQNVTYVEVDRWESTQPRWYLRIVQQSDAFQPVRGFGPRKRPSVIVFRVNHELLG
ncbi:MAG: glycosyltransferase family 39 protein [Candidatus Nanohaloarchaea archaeon]|nr:glycosyltransferase family 39 protein [Candidatus Nanohaloarchaea archaeon]